MAKQERDEQVSQVESGLESREGPKLVRAIFEMDDGSVKYLEGVEAAKWVEIMDGMMTLAYVHGNRGTGLDKLNWKETTKEGLGRLINESSTE